jgi:hypothetical protein
MGLPTTQSVCMPAQHVHSASECLLCAHNQHAHEIRYYVCRWERDRDADTLWCAPRRFSGVSVGSKRANSCVGKRVE